MVNNINETGTYKRHRVIVDKCIDRLCELGQFMEVAELFRYSLFDESQAVSN